jgi:hypothetical protein
MTPWEAEQWSVLGPFASWRDEHRAWSANDDDALSNFLERFRFERAVRRAHNSALRQHDG